VGTTALSFATVAVLHAVAAGHSFGFDIVDATGLTAGSVYPALDRLEELGLLVSSWEDAADAQADKRPPRRNFALTADGARVLAEALQKHKTLRPVSLKVFGIAGMLPARRRP